MDLKVSTCRKLLLGFTSCSTESITVTTTFKGPGNHRRRHGVGQDRAGPGGGLRLQTQMAPGYRLPELGPVHMEGGRVEVAEPSCLRRQRGRVHVRFANLNLAFSYFLSRKARHLERLCLSLLLLRIALAHVPCFWPVSGWTLNCLST